ncbi:hypothetical protein LJB99_02930 [Deltaproteobacteria bacterium OttesenSCG-928-K17]|nr:hypothetical protein [Deltaproteobacteria bacterium OttesenSCG-928-K17]
MTPSDQAIKSMPRRGNSPPQFSGGLDVSTGNELDSPITLSPENNKAQETLGFVVAVKCMAAICGRRRSVAGSAKPEGPAVPPAGVAQITERCSGR